VTDRASSICWTTWLVITDRRRRSSLTSTRRPCPLGGHAGPGLWLRAKDRVAWMEKAEAPALQGSLELQRLASDKGWRSSSDRSPESDRASPNATSSAPATPQPADHEGTGAEVLDDRGVQDSGAQAPHEEGLRIVINIGDQASDLAGGYAEAPSSSPIRCTTSPKLNAPIIPRRAWP